MPNKQRAVKFKENTFNKHGEYDRIIVHNDPGLENPPIPRTDDKGEPLRKSSMVEYTCNKCNQKFQSVRGAFLANMEPRCDKCVTKR